MRNNYYIKYSDLSKLNDTQTPVGVIIDTREIHYDEFIDFMTNLNNEKLNYVIHTFILVTEFSPIDTPNLLKENTRDDFFYCFHNEEDFREEIGALEHELKSQIIGYKVCATGIDILMHRFNGISNIIVTSPFLNDENELQMLKKLGYRIFATANQSNPYKEFVSPCWIRPEGIPLYEETINDFFIVSDENVNINVALNAYISNGYLGDIKDFLVGFNIASNTFRDSVNLITGPFDYKRTVCKADCMRCKTCEREFELAKQLLNRQTEKNKV